MQQQHTMLWSKEKEKYSTIIQRNSTRICSNVLKRNCHPVTQVQTKTLKTKQVIAHEKMRKNVETLPDKNVIMIMKLRMSMK